MRTRTVLMMGALLCAAAAMADTFYVSTNGTAVAPYDSWTTAATNIQDAVDAAASEDMVLVTNGVYNTGGAEAPGNGLWNMVCITNAVTVQSVNGPEHTMIEAADCEMRVVYMMSNAVLSGFTVQGGEVYTDGGGIYMDQGGTVSNCIVFANYAENNGGGIYCNGGGTVIDCAITNNETAYGNGGGVYCNGGGMLTGCTLSDNYAENNGGGSYGGTLSRCTLSGNTTYNGGGGGSLGGVLYNCLLTGNTTLDFGGGSCVSTLINCTLTDNDAEYGGGSFGGALTNCIVWGNRAQAGGSNYYDSAIAYSCTAPLPAGTGNMAADPLFFDNAYHLQAGSPCIDAGTPSAGSGQADLDGNPRNHGGTVDMGAYEYGLPTFTATGSAVVEHVGELWGTADWTVGLIAWSNAANGASGSIPVSGFQFQVSGIPLESGCNTLFLTGTNAQGEVASDRFGLYSNTAIGGGSCLELDGADDCASVPYDSSLDCTDAITIEAWVYYRGGENYPRIIDRYPAPSIYIRESDGALGWYGTIGGVSRDFCFTNSVVPADQWTHVAVTYDGTTVRASLNGTPTATQSYSGALGTSTGGLTLGNRAAGDRALDGRLDEVRIWSDVRSESELLDRMHRKLSGSEEGLVACYSMDGTGITLADSSVNGNHGTLANGAARVDSTVPYAVLIAGASNIRAAWSGMNSPTHPSDWLHIDDAGIIGNQQLLFGHNGATGQTGADVPPGVGWRLNRVWQFESAGVSNANLRFDVSCYAFTYAPCILVDDDGDFSDAALIPGTLNGSTLEVDGLAIRNGGFCTLADGMAAPGRCREDPVINLGQPPQLQLGTCFTIEAWVRGSGPIFSNIDAGNEESDGFQFMYGGCFYVPYEGFQGLDYECGFGIAVMDESGTTQAHARTRGEDNEWHHVALVRNGFGSTTEIYLDGVLQPLEDGYQNLINSDGKDVGALGDPYVNDLGEIVNAPGCTNDCYIGRGLMTDDEFENRETVPFIGHMDEVRIWNVARSHAQIAGAMHRRLNGDEEEGLVACYTFDETGSTAYDHSIYSNHCAYVSGSAESCFAFNSWTGRESADWHAAGNWSLGSVPGASTHVGIPACAGTGPEITTAASCMDLNIAPGGMLAAHADLTVNGHAANLGELSGQGAIVLNSGSKTNNWRASGNYSAFGRFANLELDHDGKTILAADTAVSGTLALTSGNLDLNGWTLDLGAAGTLAETGGRCFGGTLEAVRTLSAPAGEDIAGLGIGIVSGADLGETMVRRRHEDLGGLLRTYDLLPAGNTNLGATLTFSYFDEELNGCGEAALQLYAWSGTAWTNRGGVVDTNLNTITLAGIDAFPARWAAGGEMPQSRVECAQRLGGYLYDFDGDSVWGDYDNDGDLDLLHTGTGYYRCPTLLYENKGGRLFGRDFPELGVGVGDLDWGDYDGDGDLDILMTGGTSGGSGPLTGIFRNDGGSFTNINADLPQCRTSTAAWGDYDNDGDLDFVLAGYHEQAGENIAQVYRNDDGTFTNIQAGLPGVQSTGAGWGDYDLDGDLDLLLHGCIYRNDTADGGGFTAVASVSSDIPIDWIDFDQDGDLDASVGGGTIVRNDNGGASWVEVDTTISGGLLHGVTWGDYDNDGDIDAFSTVGPDSDGTLYANDGGSFTSSGDAFFDSGKQGRHPSYASAALGDCDGDGDLDLFSGLTTLHDADEYEENAALWRNDSPPNSVPTAPGNLRVDSFEGGRLVLGWAAASDVQTPAAALSYNLRVGTAPGLGDVMPAHSDPATGFRRIVKFGNVCQNTAWPIAGLDSNTTYYAAVQAVDAACAGGPWSDEISFRIADYPSVTTAPVSSIGLTTAAGGGNVASQGASPVVARGICWSTSAAPTVADAHTVDGSGLGAFTSSITGLDDRTTYFVRAYASNSTAIAYGLLETFTSGMYPPGNALDFDGASDYVSLPDTLAGTVAGTEAITIEYWFRGTNLQSPVRLQDGNGYIVAGWHSSNPQHLISTDGGTSGISCGDEAVIEDGNWHHLAMTWERNTTNGFKAYLDGSLVAERDSADAALPPIASGAYLGAYNGSSEFLSGTLDEVRIWSIARTAAEIRADMRRELTGGEAGLVAYYRFNQQNTAAVDDLTANGNDGTVSGAAWVVSTVPWFSLTAAAGENGTIAPAGEVYVARNGTTNFIVTPGTYWHIADVATNGISVGAVSQYTWSNVTADGTIHAAFAADLAAHGTPHWWLAQYGLTNGGWTFDQAETNNPDADPFTSGDEYIADTDPTNAATYFHIVATSNLPPFTVYFDSSSNRWYTLRWNTNLVGGQWSEVGSQMGAGGLDSMSGTNNASAEFYKLEVARP